MEDHGLDHGLKILAELPREQAREGFTARVLTRLDREDRQASWKRPRLVFATAALLAVMASAGVIQYRADQKQEEARRVLRELRSEHESLKHELESLSAPPVVYVGGDEQVDLVVDLSRVQGASF
ncbi:MAG: hypothetical protein ABUT39_15295 [Acidobacteriota bacterium]